jgi:hypothetical protein
VKGKKKAIIVIKIKASKCSNGDGGFQHVIVVTEEEQEVVRPQGFLPSFSCSKGFIDRRHISTAMEFVE